MAAMKLYYFPVAPNPTKVRIYLREKGIDLDEVLVDFRTREHRGPEHLARNPLGKLPVLELEDGSYIAESLPIMEYLEELYPAPVMIGSNPEARARVRALERLIDWGILMPIGRIVHSTDSPLGYKPNPAIAEAELRGLPRLYGIVNDLLGEAQFVAGEEPTIADCTLYAGLNFGRFRDIGPDEDYTHLHRWFAEFGERPSVVNVNQVSLPPVESGADS